MPTVEAPLLEGSAPEAEILRNAAGTVIGYLTAMEARDLAAAEAALGPGFRMQVPGTSAMTSLSELIGWARNRYRFVRKATDAVEAFESGGAVVVYIRGTLRGAWPDGSPFEGIRFIDRFEVADGKIVRQDVWNDIAEVRGR